MLGFGCMIGAVPCTVSALSLIPLSLAAPFSGLTIIFSLLLAATGVLTEREVPEAAAYLVAGLAHLYGDDVSWHN